MADESYGTERWCAMRILERRSSEGGSTTESLGSPMRARYASLSLVLRHASVGGTLVER